MAHLSQNGNESSFEVTVAGRGGGGGGVGGGAGVAVAHGDEFEDAEDAAGVDDAAHGQVGVTWGQERGSGAGGGRLRVNGG